MVVSHTARTSRLGCFTAKELTLNKQNSDSANNIFRLFNFNQKDRIPHLHPHRNANAKKTTRRRCKNAHKDMTPSHLRPMNTLLFFSDILQYFKQMIPHHLH